jgi:rhamnosyltransferase
MNRTKTDISIIIPTSNGAPKISNVLEAIFHQQSQHKYEVIVIDSGSTDSTLDIVKRYPVFLHFISPTEFSHSRTRNIGASLAGASEYLVFLNQDAVPTDVNWLENLVRSIKFMPDIKAVCAIELNPMKMYFNVCGVAEFIFRNSHTKGVHVIDANIMELLPDLPKSQLRELFPFSTVCALFEKDHFNKYPFDENVEWGEDLYWAVSNSQNGYRSACSSLASVYHYHNYTLKELKALTKHTEKVFKDLFDWTIPHDYLISARSFNRESEQQFQARINYMSWKCAALLRRLHSIICNKKWTRSK